jgi:Cys-tRNA(Pro) deacylase
MTTQAERVLRAHGVAYATHEYRWVEGGGTAASARELGVDEHAVVKTLVMEDDARAPLLVLMHGDRQVSTRALARIVGARSVAPCAPEVANRHSGYVIGGTSPFGTPKRLPVYVERTLLDLPRVWVNGGRRGFLVSIDPREFVRVLGAQPVDAAASG